MRNAKATNAKTILSTFIALVICLCMLASCAYADAFMPVYTEAPAVPVYWQLTKIDLEPQIRTKGGFTAEYEAEGFALDLSDPLMAESVANAGQSDPVVSLTIENSARAQKQSYTWTPMPIYMEPGQHYAIEITGESAENTEKLDSLLSVNEQGRQVLRVSAGGYNGKPASAVYDLAPLNTEEMVVSFVVRDVNDMFRLRVAYTYELVEGVRPYPTPVPGFVATEAPAEIPSFYEPVEGREGLWRVTTKPDEYRAYGVMTGEGPNFFPADENGDVVMDETPVTPEQDYDSFVAGFVPWTAETEPANYTKNENGVYSFTTRDGATEYRAYGRMNGGEAAFYPSDENGVVAGDAQPVEPEADFEAYQKGFGAAEPQQEPALYENRGGVYAFTGRDGQTQYRVYGRLDGADAAFYPSDENGAVAEGAQPVSPEADFEAYVKGFDVAEPAKVPDIYEKQENGVYAVEDREGGKVYRVYGVKDGQAPAWYPCDENGVVADDAQAVTAEEDFAAYYEGFEPARADGAPRYYSSTKTPSVFMFTDSEGKTQYRIYGSKDRGEPAWYPCDERGNVEPNALPVQPASDLATIAEPQFVPAEPQEVPAYYERVGDGVFAVEDRDGNRVYRTYGDYDSYLETGTPAWYPCDENGAVAEGAQPIDPAQDYTDFADGFAARRPEQVPAYYEAGENGVYAVEKRDGTKDYRVYGRVNGAPAAWYAADEDGNLLDAQGAPIDPYDDFVANVQGFEPETPAQTPEYYKAGENGVYSFENADGVTEYRVYGRKDRGEANWYPADAEGNVVSEDAQPVDLAREFDDHIKGFVPETPDEEDVPSYYQAGENGVYSFQPADGETQYRVYGRKDRGESAWYPADQNGELLEDAEPVTPNEEIVTTLPMPETKSVVVGPVDAATAAVTAPAETAEPTSGGVVNAGATDAAQPQKTEAAVPAIATVVTEPAETAAATEEPVIVVTSGATVTEAPTAEQPTEVPATEQPTEGPATEAPATEQPTEAPATEVPATEQPTEGPATETPATEQPTEAPATEAPATEQPTEAPATEAPATEQPTEAPATEAPADEKEETAKSNNTWIAWIAALIIALGGGTTAVVKGKKKKK